MTSVETIADVRKLIPEAEAAARLGLKNPQTLAVYRCLGLRGKKNFRLRHVKVGRHVYYTEQAIAEYLASCQCG